MNAEHREKIADAMRRKWRDKDYRTAVVATLNSPGTQSALKQKTSAWWSKPENHKRVVSWWTPERRRERAEQVRAERARRKVTNGS